MAAAIEVSREQWLGYRWQGHGFGDRDAALDDLLLLGFQDSRQSGAEQSQRQRTGKAPARGLVSMWSVRGAPHTHRASHLDFVRDALAPRDCDEGGADYVEAVGEVAAALTKVVTSPTTKSDASSEVTRIVAKSLVTWCERCGADHVPDGLFRDAGRQAQLVLGDDTRTTMLKPTPKASQVAIDNPRLTLLTTFIRVNGSTSKTLFRDWVGGSTAGVAQEWGQLADVVRVQVDNKRLDLPERLVDDVTNAPRAEGVVLVPPNDAYLRQVDRTLLVSDSKLRQQVWKAVSGPGALLIDGEVAGVWRYRRNDQTLTITPFGKVSAKRRAGARDSAQRVADVAGEELTVVWDLACSCVHVNCPAVSAPMIAPSILSADFARLADEAKAVEGADWLHVDVMDAHFVPNLTLGLPIVESLLKATDIPLDCHLMIDDPARWAPPYAEAGAHNVTFHAEASDDPVAVARDIRAAGAKAGLSIKPGTPIEPYLEILKQFDTLLVMSVEPGFGGQSFIAEVLSKARAVRKLVDSGELTLLVEIDGGINDDTVEAAAEAGVDCFVAGSAVYGASDPAAAVRALRSKAARASHHLTLG